MEYERRILLGTCIATVRQDRGLTQRELAAMVGTSNSYIWKIETGRTGIGFDALCKIADALDVSVRELVRF